MLIHSEWPLKVSDFWVNFQVLAIDVPSEGEVPKTGTVQVEVTVTDINDNSPIITTPGKSHIRGGEGERWEKDR